MFEKHNTYVLDDYQIADALNKEAGIDEWDTENPNYLDPEDIMCAFVDEGENIYIATYTHFIQLHFGRGYIADIVNMDKRGYITDKNRLYYAIRLRILEWLVRNFESSDKNNVLLRIGG